MTGKPVLFNAKSLAVRSNGKAFLCSSLDYFSKENTSSTTSSANKEAKNQVTASTIRIKDTQKSMVIESWCR